MNDDAWKFLGGAALAVAGAVVGYKIAEGNEKNVDVAVKNGAMYRETCKFKDFERTTEVIPREAYLAQAAMTQQKVVNPVSQPDQQALAALQVAVNKLAEEQLRYQHPELNVPRGMDYPTNIVFNG